MEDILLSCLIFIASSFLYSNSIFCTFVFDDISAIVKNKDVTGETPLLDLLWNDYWGTSMLEESSHKSYRPFTVLTFRLNHSIFGSDPWSFHLVNLLLYGFVCVLTFHLYKIVVRLCTQEHSISKYNLKKYYVEPDGQSMTFISTTATLLFVVHSVHVEAVTSVVGRAELLSAMFFILSILFYLQSSLLSIIISLLFCVFAVASKEQGITALAVCAFLDIVVVQKLTLDEFCLVLVTFFMSPRRSKFKSLLLRLLLLASVAAILLYFRYKLMRGTFPYFTVFDNPSAAASFPTRHLTLNYLLSVNAWLLLNPNNLLCDWTMGTIALVESGSDVKNIATLLFWLIYAALSFSVFLRGFQARLCSVAVVIATVTFLPASNLFFYVGFVVAERVLFLPSLGFCLLVATGLWMVKTKFKCDRLVWALICFILFSQALKTFHRNFEWKNDMELFKSGLKVNTNNAKLWNNVGHAYEDMGNHQEALDYFTQATMVEARDIGAHMNVARMHEALRDKRSAELAYWKAKSLLPKPVPGKSYTARVAPSNLRLFTKLGNLLKEQGRFDDALALYEEAITMRHDYVDAHIHRGEVLTRMNKLKEALESYSYALRLKPEKISDVYFNIGVVNSRLGNISAAVEAYTFAIVDDPNHVKSLFNSAVIFRETGDENLLRRAMARVERVLRLEPKNVMALTLGGSVYMDLGQHNNAIKWWKEALAIDPSQPTCLFNLAYIYSKMEGRTMDCVIATEELFRHHPNHVKGLLLYGDVMLKDMKDVKRAQRAYSRLIELEPTNVEGQHNYCVTLVEQRQLKEAESCLLRVYAMAPNEDYIQDNLALVRRQLNLMEIRERDAEKRKETNFRVTRSPNDDVTRPQLEESVQDESQRTVDDVIYVAKPDGKPVGEEELEEARRIKDSLQDFNENDVDANLRKAAAAVARLREIRLKVSERTKQCRSSSAKENALNFLDELESQLP